MDVHQFFDTMIHHAGVRTIFGEPVNAQGRTIIPVVRAAYGLGGGSGGLRPPGESGSEAIRRIAPGAGGGGAGFAGTPVGVFEISAEGTRFVPVQDRKRIAIALAAGLLVGFGLARKLLTPR